MTKKVWDAKTRRWISLNKDTLGNDCRVNNTTKGGMSQREAYPDLTARRGHKKNDRKKKGE